MKKSTLEKIQKILETRKNQLEKELASFAKRKTKMDESTGDIYDSEFPHYGDKIDENAAEVAAYGDRKSVEESLEKTLRDVINALQKIKKGNYGICRYCGKEIEEKRLLARPDSSACVACKTKLSKR